MPGMSRPYKGDLFTPHHFPSRLPVLAHLLTKRIDFLKIFSILLARGNYNKYSHQTKPSPKKVVHAFDGI